jgi:hypothetical protein
VQHWRFFFVFASNEKLEIQSPIFDNLVISLKKLEIVRVIIFFYSLLYKIYMELFKKIWIQFLEEAIINPTILQLWSVTINLFKGKRKLWSVTINLFRKNNKSIFFTNTLIVVEIKNAIDKTKWKRRSAATSSIVTC